MLKINHLDFFYEDKQVLYDISLQLDSGSITGLIGHNGAGKSTLMRCMAGLEQVAHGEVLLNGKAILDNPRESFAQLGYLPDIFGLPERLTVVQCLTYAAKLRGLSDAILATTLSETLDLLGLYDKAHVCVGNLSRGQKQRVGIGQVIVHKPKLLLLDEPASGLDPEARYELSRLLLNLKAQGMTLLVSSHILSELDEYCTHMLAVKNGRIQAHQALYHGEVGMQTVAVQFFRLPENAMTKIPKMDFVEKYEQKGSEIWFTISSKPEVRVALLRELVQCDLPVMGANTVKTTLLQTYQDSLHTAKGNHHE